MKFHTYVNIYLLSLMACIVPVYLQVTDAERIVQNPGFVELAPCPCDITENQCDINCCCDDECSTQNKARFKSCIPGLAGGQGGGKEDYRCGTKAFNPPDWHLLTCVYWESNAYLGMFFMNKAKLNKDEFTSDAVKYMKNEFSLREDENRYKDKDFPVKEYREGIIVSTRKAGSGTTPTTSGLLALSQHINSGQCNPLAPVRFLEPVQSMCQSQLTTASCSALSIFSANIYAVSSAITANPRPFQVASTLKGTDIAEAEVRYYCINDITDYLPTTTPPATSGSNFPNTLQNVDCDEPCSDDTCWQYNTNRAATSVFDRPLPTTRCTFDNGQTLPPNPSVNGGNCENVVLDVRYSFEWKGQNIARLIADVILANQIVISANPELAQRFSVKWTYSNNETSSSVNDNYFNSSQPYQRSGIAGYEPRTPLISGCQERDPTTDQFQSVDVREEKQMAIFKPGVDGLCENALRQPLTFGVDSMSSCAVQLNLNNLVACDDLRRLISNHLNVLMPSDVIGRYGYNNPKSEDMWISVIRQNLTEVYESLAPTFTAFVVNQTDFRWADSIAGICFLPTSVNLNILYAKTGAINFHPRLEVIGAYINYTFSNWTMECMGSNSLRCDSTSGLTQNFFLHSTVRYVKVPPTPPTPKTRFYTKINPETCDSDTCYRFFLDWDTDICYYDTCWQELAYPLTSTYDGDSHEYALAFFLVLVLGVVGYASVAKPGWS